MVNHAWLEAAEKSSAIDKFRGSRAGTGFGWALTFVSVVVGWVFFRAPNLDAALTILGGMSGRNGIAIPAGRAFALEPVQGLVSALGIVFSNESGSNLVESCLWIMVLLAIAFWAPNTQQLMRAYAPALNIPGTPSLELGDAWRHALSRVRWVASPGWAITTGVLAFLGTISIVQVSEFLYSAARLLRSFAWPSL